MDQMPSTTQEKKNKLFAESLDPDLQQLALEGDIYTDILFQAQQIRELRKLQKLVTMEEPDAS